MKDFRWQLTNEYWKNGENMGNDGEDRGRIIQDDGGNEGRKEGEHFEYWGKDEGYMEYISNLYCGR